MTENISLIMTPSNELGEMGRLISCVKNLESFTITKQPFTVGRSKHCDVVIENAHLENFVNNVSKEHFIITKDSISNVICLTDVSKNGTFVNGKKVGKNQRVVLNDGSKLAVGHVNCCIFTFRCVLVEDLPSTLTPLSLSPQVDRSNMILPMWGRLVSCMIYLESIDLTKPILKVGRSSICDVVIDQTKIKHSLKQIFSKEHFSICKDSDNLVTYITDHSKSGTYLNGCLIGKRNSNILQPDDIISIGDPKIKMYLYKCMYPPYSNDLPPGLKKKYEPTKLLGKGAVGEVRLAFEKTTCKMFAIKKITKSTTSEIHKMNHPNKIRSEINILRNLSHPFVINLKDIDETPQEVFLVLEYMEGGELTNRILSTIPLTESNIKFLFYQMVLAVEFLHSKGITHRDLKPENVLLASEEIESLIKVSDFGLSKITSGNSAMQTVCGTLYYIAPEMLDSPTYNKQVDIWSLGVILFYMFAKHLPFKTKDRANMIKLIRAGEYKMDEWKSVSENAKDLVKRMLVVDPLKRITISEIQKHPWLTKDIDMKNRVSSLLESNTDVTEELIYNIDKEPPSKRIRLSESED